MSGTRFSGRQLAALAVLAVLGLAAAVTAVLGAPGVAAALVVLLQVVTVVVVVALRNQMGAVVRQQRATATAVQRLEAALERAVHDGVEEVAALLSRDERQALLQSLVDTVGADRLDAVQRHEELLRAVDRLDGGTAR